jgi:hypothetical protein
MFGTTTGLEPIGYRGALLSSLLQANVYVTHNLLNVLVQIANKMGLKKKFGPWLFSPPPNFLILYAIRGAPWKGRVCLSQCLHTQDNRINA